MTLIRDAYLYQSRLKPSSLTSIGKDELINHHLYH